MLMTNSARKEPSESFRRVSIPNCRKSGESTEDPPILPKSRARRAGSANICRLCRESPSDSSDGVDWSVVAAIRACGLVGVPNTTRVSCAIWCVSSAMFLVGLAGRCEDWVSTSTVASICKSKCAMAASIAQTRSLAVWALRCSCLVLARMSLRTWTSFDHDCDGGSGLLASGCESLVSASMCDCSRDSELSIEDAAEMRGCI